MLIVAIYLQKMSLGPNEKLQVRGNGEEDGTLKNSFNLTNK
jgi:hypothetical protein